MSESVSTLNKLSFALCIVQGKIQHATKTQANEAFKRAGKATKYADIADVIEVIQTLALENGLSVRFNYKTTFDQQAGMQNWIQYIIEHSSGESRTGDWIVMLLRDENLHAWGAASTYMKRQLLKSIYQIPEEDDDGNSQSLPQKTQQNAGNPVKKQATHAEEIDKTLQGDGLEEFRQELLTELYSVVKNFDIPDEEARMIIKAKTGKNSSKDCTPTELNSVIKFIKATKSP